VIIDFITWESRRDQVMLLEHFTRRSAMTPPAPDCQLSAARLG